MGARGALYLKGKGEVLAASTLALIIGGHGLRTTPQTARFHRLVEGLVLARLLLRHLMLHLPNGQKLVLRTKANGLRMNNGSLYNAV